MVERFQISLRVLLVATVVLGVVFGLLLIPFFRASLRVGWFAAPLEMGGLDTFGLVAVGFGVSSIPAGLWLAGLCFANSPGRAAARFVVSCVAFCWITFFLLQSVSATKILVLFCLISLLVCTIYEVLNRQRGWIVRIALGGVLWLSFWFIASGLILTL